MKVVQLNKSPPIPHPPLDQYPLIHTTFTFNGTESQSNDPIKSNHHVTRNERPMLTRTLFTCLTLALIHSNLALAQPTNLEARKNTSYVKAMSAVEDGRLKIAKKLISDALETSPDNAEVNFRYGEIMGAYAQQASVFTALSYAKKSLTGFKKAVKIEPNSVKYRFGLLSFYLQAPGYAGGDTDLALEQAEAITSLDKVEGFKAELEVYYTLEDLNKQKRVIAAAMQSMPKEPDIYIRQGFVHDHEEDYADALINMQQAIQYAEKRDDRKNAHLEALFHYGRIAHKSKSHLKEGLQHLLTFNALSPNSDLEHLREWNQWLIANIYEDMGNQEKAIKLFEKLNSETTNKELKKKLKEKI